MSNILVTGATGQLGTPTVTALRAAGHEVRAMSRTSAPNLVTADLLTGAGVAAALEAMDVVVHLATTNGAADVRAAQRLVEAAHLAGVGHLVLISIVGIDQIPIGFYRDRVTIEQTVRRCTIPFTIQRSTQFHSLVARMFSSQRFSPALVVPSIRLQPIDLADVAARLTELASGPPQGAVPDIGGPEVLAARDFAQTWLRATGRRRPLVPLHLPGKVFAAYDAGANLVEGDPYGQLTFASYLARQH